MSIRTLWVYAILRLGLLTLFALVIAALTGLLFLREIGSLGCVWAFLLVAVAIISLLFVLKMYVDVPRVLVRLRRANGAIEAGRPEDALHDLQALISDRQSGGGKRVDKAILVVLSAWSQHFGALGKDFMQRYSSLQKREEAFWAKPKPVRGVGGADGQDHQQAWDAQFKTLRDERQGMVAEMAAPLDARRMEPPLSLTAEWIQL